MSSQILSGIDHFLQQTKYKDKRIALVTNDAALTSQEIKTRVALLKTDFTLVKLFSPEHGLNANAADGTFVQNSIDDVAGLPVISLYGDHLAPTEKDVEDVDIILFNIPDVGCRFYTYLWTMAYVMEACAAFNKPFILLDRHNPIGGNILLAEGPMPEENCSSFIGRWGIPIRHCCTLGELAKYFAATKIKGLQLEIIRVTNWQRNKIATSFTPTSPAIKNITTALLYPGMGLLEGINVNEGRCTDKPFTVCGAPWINSEELAHAFTQKKCEGFFCKPYSYTPVEGLYAVQNCNGLEFFISDENIFRSVATGIKLLQTIFKLYPSHVKEREYATRANPSGLAHLDKLLGIQHAFDKIKNGKINTEVKDWRGIIKPYLLY
ncbi:MAG TPA: DUF1343 domain-containing protein [Chitinophagaceae bacterium]